MADPDTAWIMYVARHDSGRQYSRIIPESVRILRTSPSEITFDQLQAERERTGLGHDLRTIEIDVPPEITNDNLSAYAAHYIATEPEFDFWDEIIGDDIVVGGVVYNGDLYAPDYEGGVRRLTEAEQAEREAGYWQREAERAADQAEREDERRWRAIEAATSTVDTGGTQSGAYVNDLQQRAAHLRDMVHHEGSSSELTGAAGQWRNPAITGRQPGVFEPPWVDVDFVTDPPDANNSLDQVWYDGGPDIGA